MVLAFQSWQPRANSSYEILVRSAEEERSDTTPFAQWIGVVGPELAYGMRNWIELPFSDVLTSR
jgi:hypothetical protein